MHGWPQLSDTVERAKIQSGEFSYLDGSERQFCPDTYKSLPLNVCEDISYDEIILYTDSHKPLVVKKAIGDGCVYFVNAKEYAGVKAVELAYREVLERLTAECIASENIYADGNRNVQFAVYERGDGGRDIYFISTDWHKICPDGVGALRLGCHRYEIPVLWGQLVKVTAFGNSALYPKDDENEVISFDGSVARLQGSGVAEFILLKDGAQHKLTVDFSNESIREIHI